MDVHGRTGDGRTGRRKVRVRRIAGALVAALLALAGAPSGAAVAAPESSSRALVSGAEDAGWVGAWGTALARSGGSCAPCTIRSTAHLSIEGSAVRVTVSNAVGEIPLVVGRTTVSLPSVPNGAGALPGSVREVTFGGQASVTVPVGEVVRSDAVVLDVEHGTDLQVSTYLPQAGTRIGVHAAAHHTSYWATGPDQAGTTDPAPFTNSSSSGYVVSAVEVAGSGAAGTLVAFGDSITDGSGSTFAGNDRWVDRLAARMDAYPPAARLGVVNAGIGGNRLLVDQVDSGLAGPNRFARDALAHGPTTILVLLGINDVWRAAQEPEDDAVTTQRVIDALTDLADQAHADGVRIVAGTLPPFKGWPQFGPESEAVRQAVNGWIRTTTVLDAVVDLDVAVRDPADPTRLRPDYDSGDGLHPGPAGYRAMAAAIDIADLLPAERTGTVALDAPPRVPATGPTTVRATVTPSRDVADAEVRLGAPVGWEVVEPARNLGTLAAGEQVTVAWEVVRAPGSAARGELVADTLLDGAATSVSAQVDVVGAGLRGEYFASEGPAWVFEDLRTTVVDETVDFPRFLPWLADRAGRTEGAAVRWTGTLTPEVGGDYTLWVRVDDGGRLWLDDELLVDRWVDGSREAASRVLALEAGRSYAVRFETYQNAGNARAVLGWESAATGKEVVPALALAPPSDGEEPELDVTVTAQARCLAGKAYVAVRATNGEDAPVDVTLTTPFGTKTFAGVAPGKNAYQSFPVRGTSVEAGEADVTATATVDGEQVSTEVAAPYDATTCS
ncbi:GDSL-type esterase/lipase family protein [Cellulosimicrobium cellulans]|uniref:GDSL-type esterase/lipase family protein n=1 Tax=Cellulosimicrobium cellulans TaxID=1710 RepID=UPI0036500925